MNKQEKGTVLKILHSCIVKPEVDESDVALVDYQMAKIKIAALPEQEDPNPYDSVVQLLRDFDLETEWDGDIYELADYICLMFKRGPYAKKEEKAMFWKKPKEATITIKTTKKEIAIATLTAVYNAVPESKELREAITWAVGVLQEQEDEA